MDLPKIIFSNPISRDLKSKIEVSSRDFVELIKNDKLNIVFSACTPHYPQRKENFLYTVKEGFFIIANNRELKYLEQFYEIQKGNFPSFYAYLEAMYYNIENYESYQAFKESTFWSHELVYYDNFLDAKKKGFTNKQEYEYAKVQGIKNKQELDDYRNSGISVYSEYLNFKKGGFKDKNEFGKAITLGFQTAEEYHEFLANRYKSRLNKINEINEDLNSAYESNRFEEFIRLKFLSIEKMADLLYLKLFEKELTKENDLQLEDIFKKIEEKLNEKFVDYEELKNWRVIRNKIAHEHYKINKDKVERSKKFFDGLFDKSMKHFKSFIGN